MTKDTTLNDKDIVELKKRVPWMCKGTHRLREDHLGRKIAVRYWGQGFCVHEQEDEQRFPQAIRRYNLLAGLLMTPMVVFGAYALHPLIMLACILTSFCALDAWLFPRVMKQYFPNLRRVRYIQPIKECHSS